MSTHLLESDQPISIDGVRLATANAGLKYKDRDDLLLVEVAPGTAAAAVFTKNKFCAAPVIVARQHFARSVPRYLLFNAGNANAGTGEPGLEDARFTTAEVAAGVGCEPTEVLPFSTGVIGEKLNVAKIAAVIPALVSNLSGDAWDAAARAILTTDTVAKHYSAQIDIDGTSYRISGFAKGSGMIRPNMATMLGFVATDAPIPASSLQPLLVELVDNSFNRITVDGDTSTNDAVVLCATGQAASTDVELNDAHPHWRELVAGLESVFQRLAKAIVRDGEGATKFIEISVSSPTREDSLAIAETIAHSPLVKTAFFASDPNWGRILAAIGRAPVESLQVDTVSIWLNDYQIVAAGARHSDYEESKAAAVMAQSDICVRVAVGDGASSATVWTCDLSYDYVRINAEYRS